jgi:hypothetical protein
MISLTIGMNKNMEESLSQMGDLLTVNVQRPYNYYGAGGGMVMISGSSSGGTGASSNELLLNDDAVEGFRQIDGVLVATAFVDLSLKAVSGKMQTWLQIRGIETEAMQLLGLVPDRGTSFTGADKYEAVFGYNVPFDFYNPRDRFQEWSYWSPFEGTEDTRVPSVDIFEDKIQFSYDYNLGEKNVSYQEGTKPVKPYTLKPVGWLPYKSDSSYYVYMPLDDVLEIQEEQQKWESNQQWNQMGGTGRKNNRRDEGYNNVIVKFTDIKYVTDGLKQIRDQGFEAYGMIESLNEMRKMTDSMQLLFGAIGGVSLFIAAIGIANTMFMSIYERTKEIGVMKVIGATLRDIRSLFLLEAAIIGFMGGVLGIGISFLVSMLINSNGISFLNQMSYGMNTGGISSIPLWLCLAALGGAVVIGTISGFFPARRAMKLSALSAIRTE